MGFFPSFALLLAAILVALCVRWCRQARKLPSQEKLCAWRLILPRGASFSIDQATAWFASLAPLLTPEGPFPSVEIRSVEKELIYSLSVPASWEVRLRGQLAAWFPEARLEPEMRSYWPERHCALNLAFDKPEVFSLRVSEPGEADPLLGVIGVLTQEPSTAGFRVTWAPSPADWKEWAPTALAALQSGNPLPPRGWRFRLSMLFELLRDATNPAAVRTGVSNDRQVGNASRKVQEPAFAAQVEVWSSGAGAAVKARAHTVAAACISGFRDPFGNSLSVTAVDKRAKPWLTLSASELASLFHVPGVLHPLVAREISRIVPPPASFVRSIENAHEPVTWLGEALLPERTLQFGLAIPERRLHTYVVGKTGTGKSTLLAGILKQDLDAGYGVGLIDPHGDLAEMVLSFVPKHRYDDVLYFNPADTDYPVAFNPLTARTSAERPLVASAVVGVFKKLYGESWGPRLEYILRNAVLALLETPSPSLLSLPRLLTDASFRKGVVAQLRDPILRTYFAEEYESYDPRFRTEAIAPILNKVGQFLASPVVRNILGQSRPGFNLRDLMDRRGVFIANLASGKIGEDNASLLGGLLVASFQLAAMSRASLPEQQRQDFFLCVDEFQHFANEAFASILSEARKYRLSLTLSHQYLDQLPPEISDAVFGNAGSFCVFRVGAPDTVRLVRELAPAFDGQDLVNLPNFRFCARLTRKSEAVPAFSGQTVPVPQEVTDAARLTDQSRARWGRSRVEVELDLLDVLERRIS